jgi:RimJ/RimL family protein N-acetyltransferase
MSIDDAAFMFELLSDPAWKKFIGDRGAKTVDDGRDYIVTKIVPMYERTGFGLYVTELKNDETPIGICGLIKRESLEDVDIGFAFLPAFRSSGYAFESASAVLSYGKTTLGINRVVAITSPTNDLSAKLLQKLGFKFERMIRLSNGEQEDMLFASDL